MPEHRYAQFCPLARSAELLGERWTLLLLRELLCGPQRFSDLRRRLPGLSSSVLAERLGRLEERGLVERRELPPPAPAALYALTQLGESLRPAVIELVRFGVRLLESPRPGDHFEPGWLRLALPAFARRTASPPLRFELSLSDTTAEIRFHVTGGRRGTRVREGEGAADVAIRCGPRTLLGLISGQVPASTAAAAGQLEASGDLSALEQLPALFDLASLTSRPQSNHPDG